MPDSQSDTHQLTRTMITGRGTGKDDSEETGRGGQVQGLGGEVECREDTGRGG